MSSIVEMLAGQIGGEGIKQISQQLGVDEQTAQQAVSLGLPMLIAALNRNSNTPEGEVALDEALSKNHDGSILQNVKSALAEESTHQDGQAILGHVLGDKQSNVQQGISQASGLDMGSSGQLLSMLAPLVMGALSQQKQQAGLDASGISNLLTKESKQTESSLGGLAQLLDMDGDGEITDDMMNLGSKLLGGLF